MGTQIEIQHRGVTVTLPAHGKDPAVIRQMAIDHINKILDMPPEPPRIMFLSTAIERTYRDKWSRIKDAKGTLRRMWVNLKILGDVPVEMIDTKAVRMLREALETTNTGSEQKPHYRSPATVNRYLAHLKTVLNNCIKLGYLGYLPEIVIISELDRRRTTTIRPSEKQELLDYMRTQRANESSTEMRRGLALQVELLFETGMRVGESTNITYGRNIQLKRRTILLTADMTKSRKPRAIPMTDKAHAILIQRYDEGFRDRPFPWDKYYVTKVWNKAKKAIGNDDPEFVPHAIRHTVATGLIRSGMPIAKVQRLLGHQNYSTTEIYTHLVADDLADDLERWSRQNNNK